MAHLVPCSACHRHVLASEISCPFCTAPLPEAPGRRPDPPAGLKRAALFAISTSLTAGLACGPSDDGSSDDVTQKQSKPTSTATAAPTSPDDDNLAAAYGAPPEPEPQATAEPPHNVGPTATPVPDDDDFLAQPEYGAPIPVDTPVGTPFDNPQPIYGAVATPAPEPISVPTPQPAYGLPPAPTTTPTPGGTPGTPVPTVTPTPSDPIDPGDDDELSLDGGIAEIDAGAAGDADDDTAAGDDEEPLPVPPYGAPPVE